ncbi:MAG: hypothetical protein ONB46_19505 [candidate division KSB1 bacterium]|nr:hypothetical protein [candidate division KSB1 bacterium]MDZ7368064.1 hypothetical protein [candidate division KSB1 bacterium]MDZ7405710.1 hypothetical protein [candidate division KSB1 bacterium]
MSDAIELIDAGYSPEAVAKQYRGLITPESVREAKPLLYRGFVKEMPRRARVAA